MKINTKIALAILAIIIAGAIYVVLTNKPKASEILAPTSSDVAPPTLLSLSTLPAQVNAGETVTISAHITDDLSGVVSASACYKIPVGDLAFGGSCNSFLPSDLEHNPTPINDTWTANILLPNTAQNGIWTIATIAVQDSEGNRKDYHNSQDQQLLSGGKFTVVNGSNDLSDPEVKWLTATPKEVNPGEIVTVQGNFIDNESGVESASICYKLPNGDLAFEGSCQGFEIKQGDEKDGVWEAKIEIPYPGYTGTWQVGTLGIDDATGNRNDLFQPANQNILSGASFIVKSTNQIIHDLKITDISAIPNPVKRGKTVTLTSIIKNIGTETETNIVVTYKDHKGNVIGLPQTIQKLEAGQEATTSVTQKTKINMKPGTYAISVNVTSVAGEQNTDDNSLSVIVTVKK